MKPTDKNQKDAVDREAKLAQALRANLTRRKAGGRPAAVPRPERKGEGAE